MRTRNITKEIMDYCAKSEHSLAEVKQKLQQWNVAETELEDLLAMLLKEKFVDDKRYAQHFVHDKWHLFDWGRIKIRHQLLQKGITEKVVEESMGVISETEYLAKLNDMLLLKWKQYLHEDKTMIARRLMSFASSKGYEEDIIEDWIQSKIGL